MLYSALDIHKMSGVVFVEADVGEGLKAFLSVRARTAEVTVTASSKSLDAAFLLRFAGP